MDDLNFIVLGSDYEWTGPNGDVSILRVLMKRLTISEAGSRVEVRGDWFHVHHKTGEPCGQGFPAYACEWTEIDRLTPWTGTRPMYKPVHIKYFCYCCEDEVHKGTILQYHTEFSPCCGDEKFSESHIGGEHDETCICKDCKKGGDEK